MQDDVLWKTGTDGGVSAWVWYRIPKRFKCVPVALGAVTPFGNWAYNSCFTVCHVDAGIAESKGGTSGLVTAKWGLA